MGHQRGILHIPRYVQISTQNGAVQKVVGQDDWDELSTLYTKTG